MNKQSKILLTLFVFLALFLHVFKFGQVPACMNADEAAYGYNAYSILKTGKDEYGSALPARLKSFGDFKLPFYSYLTVPPVTFFGLSEFSTRLPVALAGIFFPVVIYLLAKKILEDEKIALLGAFLISISPLVQTMARQAQEAVVASFFISIAALFLLRLLERKKLWDGIIFSFFAGLSLFSYHISRLLVAFLFLYFLYHLLSKKGKLATLSRKIKGVLAIAILIPIIFFLLTELVQSPERVKNLLFFKNPGFHLKVQELRGEHNIFLFHNKGTHAILELTNEYLRYFSPEFWVMSADGNFRFGHPGISPITPVEYVLFFAGIFFLFRSQLKHKNFLMMLLLVAPLSASLAWQSYALNRAFFMIVPAVMIVSIGAFGVIGEFRAEHRKKIVIISGLAFLFFLLYSWDFYFFHYPKRATVIRSWQCGNREMAEYVNQNYDRFDKFYITRKNGQPYIFLLFYMRYPPEKYQQQAKLSAPDEFGFGQVESFDKFDFNFKFDPKQKSVALIGYPDDFNNIGITESQVKKIRVGTEEIFWIYEH